VKALVLHGIRDLRVEEVAKPKPSAGEVLIRVKACGICGTDLHFYKGEWRVKLPLIPGHEFSGIVEEVGPGVEELEEGMPVVAEPNITCGRCYYCRMKDRNFYCPNIRAVGVDVDGAFAEYVKVPAGNVYTIPRGMPFEEAALIEPLACCLRGLDNVGIELGDTVAVVGVGPIGLLMIQLSKIWGAVKVYAIDLIRERLNLAKQLGADVIVNASKEDPVKAVLSDTNDVGVDVAIEAAGSSRAMDTAVKLARRGGRVLIFGVAPQEEEWRLRPFELYEKELTIVASYRSPYTFQRAVRVASSGRVLLGPIISHVMPLERGPEAFEKLSKKTHGMIKVVLKP